MVIGWKGFPRWAMVAAPVLGLAALCLVVLYGSGRLHQAPSSFGIDGQGRLYLAMDEGVMLAEADGTLHRLPLWAKHAALTISETDVMTVAANGTLITVDLAVGNPMAGDLRATARAADENSRTFFAIQRAARRVERGGAVYRLRSHLLRYEIV